MAFFLTAGLELSQGDADNNRDAIYIFLSYKIFAHYVVVVVVVVILYKNEFYKTLPENPYS